MNLRKEDILDALGIEAETNWLPIALAGFGVGCLVGGAVALLLAPKAGTELREDIVGRGRDIISRGREFVGQERERMSERVSDYGSDKNPPQY
jgi:gas vesicle protein